MDYPVYIPPPVDFSGGYGIRAVQLAYVQRHTHTRAHTYTHAYIFSTVPEHVCICIMYILYVLVI